MVVLFLGVSVIPNGLHFVYHSTGMGARQGFFINANKNDIIVTSWDPSSEEISIVPLLSEAAIANLKNGIHRGDLNKNLGPYPLAQHSNWVNLTNMITGTVLDRADVPIGTLVYPGDVDDDAHLSTRVGVMKPYFPGLARVPRFTPVRQMEVVFSKDIVAMSDVSLDEISRLHMDKSSFVASLVTNHFCNSYEDLLGELQLSFMLFMMIYSYPALEHWKLLINILCQCEKLMLSKPAIYAKFLRILYEQLSYSPDDFFHTELSQENFLRPAMTSLFQMLNADGLHTTLQEHRRRLLTFVRKKFSLFEENAGELYFNSENVPLHRYNNASSMAPSADELYNLVDEDRPVIVHLDDEAGLDLENEFPPFSFSSASVGPDIDPKDFEKEKFGWRYPGLYNYKETTEDMTMAAVRLIELSHRDESSEINIVDTMALYEAKLFIENEVPLFGSSAVNDM